MQGLFSFNSATYMVEVVWLFIFALPLLRFMALLLRIVDLSAGFV
jgi:hypothetical protein